MANEARDAYIRAVFELSRVSPDAWGNFVEHFKWMTVIELEAMANAPPDRAQTAVGMAKKMKEIRDDFINVEAIAAKIKK